MAIDRFNVNPTTSQDTHRLPREASLAMTLKVLRTGDFQSRWEVMKLLPGFGTSAIAPLVALVETEAALEVDETDGELLWFAARILGQFQHPDAIAALVNLIQAVDRDDIAGIAATALASIGPTTIPQLVPLLDTSATRPFAIQALAQINSPATVDWLLTAVGDAEPSIRATAIEALSHFRDSRVDAALLHALADPFAPVRRAAVSSLGVRAKQMANGEVALQLQPCLYDVNAGVANQAAIALGRIGSEAAVAALVERLQQSAPLSLQLELVRALQRCGSKTALDAIAQQLQTTFTHPTEFAEALQQEIVAGLGRIETEPAKQQAAAIAQQCLASPFCDQLSPPVKQSLALSLGQLGQPQAIEALTQLLADSETGVRLHALAALKQLNARSQLIALRSQEIENSALAIGITEALSEWPA